MRHYHDHGTIGAVALSLTYSLVVSILVSDTAHGEEPAYPATPPVTQSDGYGVVPYAPYAPTMVTRPESWPQGSAQPQVSAQPQGSAPYQENVQPSTSTQPSPAVGGGCSGGTCSVANGGYGAPVGNGGYNYPVTGNQYNYPVTGGGSVTPGRVTDLPFSAAAEIKPVSDAMLLARVGNEVILASDVFSQFAMGMLGEVDQPIPEEYREQILKNMLKGVVETKLMYADLKRSVPEEGLSEFTKQLEKSFADDKEQGLPALMKKAKVQTREELEKKLQMLGSSLEAQKRLYVERSAARYKLSQEVKVDEPVTHEQMLAYYYEHGTDFDHKARTKWEQLTIRFSRHQDKQEAYRLIAQAGNQIMRGAAFAEVAKQCSEGVTAADGGKRDWTEKGSLASQKLDNALFGLPVGQLSQIIEDEQGFHILRVAQREEAYRTPFLEAQEKIKETIINDRFRERADEYIVRLKKETLVWTVYDDEKNRCQNLAETRDESERR